MKRPKLYSQAIIIKCYNNFVKLAGRLNIQLDELDINGVLSAKLRELRNNLI